MMNSRFTRRRFLGHATIAGLATPVVADLVAAAQERKEKKLFKISLAQWSLHRTLRAGTLDALDFARAAREDYDIDAIEYVNSFFKDKARDEAYLDDLKKRATQHRVKSLLIMVDGEGALGDPDTDGRRKAVDNHVRWIEAAKFLGCHSIRVNARSAGTPQEQHTRAADGLRRLTELADPHGTGLRS